LKDSLEQIEFDPFDLKKDKEEDEDDDEDEEE
jgi:hypothetical protein